MSSSSAESAGRAKFVLQTISNLATLHAVTRDQIATAFFRPPTFSLASSSLSPPRSGNKGLMAASNASGLEFLELTESPSRALKARLCRN